MIRELYKDDPRIRVMSYDCLTIDFAQEVGAKFIVRGIRTVKDFEYEETLQTSTANWLVSKPFCFHGAGTDLCQLYYCTRAIDL